MDTNFVGTLAVNQGHVAALAQVRGGPHRQPRHNPWFALDQRRSVLAEPTMAIIDQLRGRRDRAFVIEIDGDPLDIETARREHLSGLLPARRAPCAQ
jgi:hypothetical protein